MKQKCLPRAFMMFTCLSETSSDYSSPPYSETLKDSCGAVFCFLPCSAATSAAGGNTDRPRRGYALCRKKYKYIYIYLWGGVLFFLELPLIGSVVSVAARADSRTVVPLSSMVMCHIWFESRQRNPAELLTLTSTPMQHLNMVQK